MNFANRLPKGSYLNLKQSLHPVLDVHAREFFELSNDFHFRDDLRSLNASPSISLGKVD